MAIAFGGINTGLPPNIVDQLVEAERVPMRNIENKKAKVDKKLKLVDELDTKVRAVADSLKELATTRGFSDMKLQSGDPNVIQGSVDPGGAVTGSWNVEVLRLSSKAAAVSNGFPDKDQTEIGVGYFKFETPEGTKEVYLNGEANTLEGAAKAINDAKLGVQAAVINDRRDPDAPFRLVVSGSTMGGDNQVSYPTLYFLDGDQDFYFDEKRPAQNGLIKIDGIEMEIPDNEIKDIIPGVVLDIKQASPGRIVNVSVKENQEVVVGKVKTFVDAANAVLSFIQNQNALNEKSDTTQTLGGDSLLRNVEQQFRRLLQNPMIGVGSQYTRLGQLGIQFQRNGTLSLDQDKFNQAIRSSPDGVRRYFVGDGFAIGLIPQTRRIVQNLTDFNTGAIGNKKNGLRKQIEQMDKRLESMEVRVQAREKTLRQQFANLEDKMSRIKQQGAVLQSRLGGASIGDFNLGGQTGG